MKMQKGDPYGKMIKISEFAYKNIKRMAFEQTRTIKGTVDIIVKKELTKAKDDV